MTLQLLDGDGHRRLEVRVVGEHLTDADADPVELLGFLMFLLGQRRGRLGVPVLSRFAPTLVGRGDPVRKLPFLREQTPLLRITRPDAEFPFTEQIKQHARPESLGHRECHVVITGICPLVQPADQCGVR